MNKDKTTESNILLTTVPLVQLQTMIESAVCKALTDNNISKDEFFDSKGIMRLFKISHTTLQTWRTNKIIPYFKIENKIFYKKSDIMLKLSELKKN